MKYILPFILALTASTATADVTRAVDTYILPGYTAFAQKADALHEAALTGCTIAIVQPAWNDVFDAWLDISHLRFGPVEKEGRAVVIAFWPDERGAGVRSLAGLIADQDQVIASPQGTAQISAAARGIYALEYLLYDPQFADTGDYGCALTRALTADLALLATQVLKDWNDGYGDVLRTAGDPGNQTYLTEREGIQALFTALLAGIEFDVEKRLGRPLGTFERPRPNRAESWRSGRSQDNLTLSLKGLKSLKDALSDAPTPVSDAAFAKAFVLLDQLEDPILAGVADPQGRFKVEIVQQSLQAIGDAVEVELSDLLGVDAGFNSADGD
ncbi:imelysin family protein [Yoonia sp. MH D7]